MSTKYRLTHPDYKVGWICALETEFIAAKAMLDEKHEPLHRIGHDDNIYILGRIGKHNVVITCLPSGRYGTTSATHVATQMRSSYPSVVFGLMVGVGGAAPSDENPIRLGDVVVSEPRGQHPGVVAFDWGKWKAGKLERTGSLNRPPQIIMGAVQMLKTRFADEPNLLEKRLSDSQFPEDVDSYEPSYEYQGQEHDRLYNARYQHVEDGQGKDWPTCDNCMPSELQERPKRSRTHPKVFYGTIASSDKVMKDAAERDRLRDELGAICFEMEAAGLMIDFPCVVIRGICDYSDSHKNKRWQKYAAATAAAYAKELLLDIQPVAG